MNWLQKLIVSLVPIRRLRPFNEAHAPQPTGRVPEVSDLLDALRAAESGDTQPLFAIYRNTLLDDLDVQTNINTRKLAILGDDWVVSPYDKEIPDDVDAAKRVEDMIADLDGWIPALNALLDGSLWPLAMVEKEFTPSIKPGQRFELRSLTRVNPQLFDWVTCSLRLAQATPDGARDGTYLTPAGSRFITHRGHLLTAPDNWGGPMRCLLFWSLLANADTDWWGRFLEKYGAPFPVGFYEPGDEETKNTLIQAFGLATRVGGLVLTNSARLELKEAASNSTGEAFDRFHQLCRRQLAKGILGQTMTSEGQAQGIGGTQANVHEGIRQDIRQWDGRALGETLRTQLFRQYLHINGWPGRAPRITWGVTDIKEADVSAALLGVLHQAGLRITDEGITILSQKVGFPLERSTPDNTITLPPSGAPALFSASRRLSPHLLDAALVEIAFSAREGVARSLRGHLADVPRLLRESRSPQEFEAGLTDLLNGPLEESPALERALTAAAANGAASNH